MKVADHKFDHRGSYEQYMHTINKAYKSNMLKIALGILALVSIYVTSIIRLYSPDASEWYDETYEKISEFIFSHEDRLKKKEEQVIKDGMEIRARFLKGESDFSGLEQDVENKMRAQEQLDEYKGKIGELVETPDIIKNITGKKDK